MIVFLICTPPLDLEIVKAKCKSLLNPKTVARYGVSVLLLDRMGMDIFPLKNFTHFGFDSFFQAQLLYPEIFFQLE